MKIVDGDIFQDDAEYLVIPVNSVGVMGKGLALQAKKRFPEINSLYRKLCADGTIRPGSITYWEDDVTGQSGYLAATKDHWRHPSRVEWIDAICAGLADSLMNSDWAMAVPALGCGLGELRWDDVLPIMVRHFARRDVRVYLPREGK